MSRRRQFDWDEARRLRSEGLSYVEIGRRLRVSQKSIRLACDDEARRKDNELHAKWQRSGACPDCGAQTTRVAGGRSLRCVPCSSLRQRTSVRETTLRCARCHEWKPDEGFPRNRAQSASRRGRHRLCRSCQTVVKREWRRRRARVAA